METIKVVKTVYPDVAPKNFDDWAKWLWSQYRIEIDRAKTGWEKNIYRPKKSN
jgi:hypothetical protein